MPVLKISYLISGLLRPRALALAFDNQISSSYNQISNYLSKIPSPYHSKIRVKGRDIVVSWLVHSTVLFTFGLAAPILVIPIMFCIITDCYTHQLLMGKTLYENDIEVVETQSHQAAINPIAQTSDIKIDTSLSNTNQSSRDGSIKADLLSMEHLDMASSYQAIDACFHFIIIFVMLFWALLFFDMIADVYGVINGIITMTCFAILPALLLIAMDKSNLILRMMSQVGLSHVIDRYLVNKLGLDMRHVKASGDSPAANRQHSGSSASSSSHDVEMITCTSRVNDND
jgi:hypothetical protein